MRTTPRSGGAPATSTRTPAATTTSSSRTSGQARTPTSGTSRSSSGFSFDRFMPLARQGWDIIGSQLGQRFGSSRSGPEPGPAAAPSPAPADAGLPAPSADRLAQLMQALQQRQIPPLPVAAPPAMAAPSWPGSPQADGLALLRLILLNPQFQQALGQAVTGSGVAPPPVRLPMPAIEPPSRMRPVDIPLGAVLNAISALTGPALMQLNARTSEEDPEVPAYLVSEEGEFVVDPSSPDDRASLVVHMFEASDEAQRLAALRRRQSRPQDETDLWAYEFGLR